MQDGNVDGTLPVLLFAMPRSGSTWVAKILDSHPDVVYRHEPDSDERIAVPLAPTAPYDESQRACVAGFAGRLPENKSTDVSGKLPLFAKNHHPGLRRALYRLYVYGTKALSRTGYTATVPDLIPARLRDRTRIVWKSIESLARLGLLLAACPGARAVHLVRHPCGQIASVLRGERTHKFAGSGASSEDYGMFEQFEATRQYRDFDLSPARLRSMSAEERLAWRWALFNDKAWSDNENDPAYRLLIYEDLCADPVSVARGMFTHCGLDWHAQSEDFIARHSSNDKEDYYSIRRDPVKAANKWRTELTAVQIERILGVTRQSRCGALFGE